MIEFTRSLRFIISFLVLILLMSMFTSTKFVYSFLVLVLLSMALLNSEKVKNILGGLVYDE
ncbi:hypothetical protein BAY68_19290 [Bacillus pumilus]|nr:hypothetical protein BAY68_19290 [Bacillus pumilus]